MKALRRIVEDILDGKITSKKELDEAKRQTAKAEGLGRFIRNSEILEHASQDERKRITPLLQKKPTRTMSGVAVVAAMTAPHECPHGKCRYCPGGPDIDVPQSYTGKEPATRRAIQYGFHPYLQTTFRLYQLSRIGHPTDKVELIVMGGTLTAQCLDYQDWFTKNCIMALNDFAKNRQKIDEVGEEKFIADYKGDEKKFRYSQDVQKENETCSNRLVGMTFEPRPDWAKREQIDYMLGFGVTRVEIGVQNPDDEVYLEVERGHTVGDVVEATAQLKDSAFKVGYHMMPGLRGYEPDFDLAAFKKIIHEDPFKPDMIKIYPCIVMEGTDFSKRYNSGEFTPMTTPEAVKLIAEIKTMLPPWMRTMRVMRDIPSNIVEAGIKNTNLGQLVSDYMGKHDMRCRCIRCREVGRYLRQGVEPAVDDIRLERTDYEASAGKEVFLSFEDVKKDMLVGFTRFRVPAAPFRDEIGSDTGLIRELHVYGPMVEIGERPEYEWQHRGYGAELIQEAEKIAGEEYDLKKMCIISGVGVRDYYRRLGYERDGPYMSKKLM